MALNSPYKRSSVPGVGRPWMRSITPDATKAAPWRQSVGLTYSGVSLFISLTSTLFGVTAGAKARDLMTAGGVDPETAAGQGRLITGAGRGSLTVVSAGAPSKTAEGT